MNNYKSNWIVLNKWWNKFILMNYIILPMIGWFMHGVISAVSAILLAYILDRFTPRWRVNLNCDNFKEILIKFQKYGVDCARLHIYVKNKKIYIFRHELFLYDNQSTPCLAIQVPEDEWQDVLKHDDKELLFRKWGSLKRNFIWRRKMQYSVTGKFSCPINSCISMLKYILEKNNADIDDIAMRVDCVKEDIWGEKITW